MEKRRLSIPILSVFDVTDLILPVGGAHGYGIDGGKLISHYVNLTDAKYLGFLRNAGAQFEATP